MKKTMFLFAVLLFSGVYVLAADAVKTENSELDADAAAANKIMLAEKSVYPDFTDDLGGEDSLEGFNRAMCSTNLFIMRYMVQPLGGFWASVMPRYGLDRIDCAMTNMEVGVRFTASVLQNEWSDGGTELARFGINTTLGVLGMYDPALNWFDFEPKHEEFGQVFASWGMGHGGFVHFPIIGPATTRDGFGSLVNMLFDIKTYIPIPGVGAFGMFNALIKNYRTFDAGARGNYDSYELSKRLYMAMRHIKLKNHDRISFFKEVFEKDIVKSMAAAGDHIPPSIPGTVPVKGYFYQGKYIDTLKYPLLDIPQDGESAWTDLSLWNSDFYNLGKVYTVPVRKNADPMPYKVWLQAGKTAPLLLLIPGTGGHYTSDEMSAVARLAYDRGYAVAIMNNAFNWEFYKTAASESVLPGYLPADVADVKNALTCLVRDLERRAGYAFPQKNLAGFSLGAIHTLGIAADAGADDVLFDRYIAVSPPVRLDFAAANIDQRAESWQQWPAEEHFSRSVYAASKYFGMKFFSHATAAAAEKVLPDSFPRENNIPVILPFSETEAEVLIAYSFYLSFDDLLAYAVSSGRVKIEGLSFENGSSDFYRQLSRVNFKIYLEKILPSVWGGDAPVMTAALLAKNSDIRNSSMKLKNRKDVFVIHSADDYIVDDADREWLREIFGPRACIFNVGGHMGYLSYPEFTERFFHFLKN